MEPDQIIERIGGDNPPTIEELTAAQTELTGVRNDLGAQIKTQAASSDFGSLVELKSEYDALTDAVSKVSEALAAAQAEIDALVAGVESGDPAPEADPEADPENAEKVPVSASVRQAVARFRTQPRDEAPVERDLTKTETTIRVKGHKVDSLTSEELGQAFADEAATFGGAKTTIVNLKTRMHEDRSLTGDSSANERKLLDLFGANPALPVTASGGCCSIPEPIYEQSMVGDLSRPIRAAFDVLQASRGAVQAYPPICIPDEGADVWTCAQDAAVDEEDPDTWKSCVELECDDVEPTLVEAAYKCLTVGTFQQRFAPEQWEAFRFQVDKLLARKLEARLFGWLEAAKTSEATGLDTNSTYLNFVNTLVRKAALIRQAQRLGDTQMVAVGPNWIYNAIFEDTSNRRVNDTEQVEFTRERVNSVLANQGITYVGSDDVASLDDAAYDSSLAPYLDTAPVVMLPAGTAKVLDGGERNLGIDVPDIALARQNKIAAFAEQWEGLLVRNCNVALLNIPIVGCYTTTACEEA